MNKRGLGFGVLVAVLAIIALSTAYAIITNNQKKLALPIGQRELELIAAYQEAEKSLLYLDTACQAAAARAAVILAAKGGNPLCGEYLGHALWGDTCTMNPDARFAREVADQLSPRFQVSDVVVAHREVRGANMTDILVTSEQIDVQVQP